ncbi:MAG: sigma-54 dependent transcriptional regulator [Deltaproteobacteria bacterium]|jgi:DNA-binding NtrC family response regulator|nr:sigma-54 dependent transcriptional regulator [Deltaproteobacteria bacterium]
MRKILIVDDEVSVRDSLRMIFKKDYQVIMAGSAEEAIIKVKSEEPDLIFLDIIMPGKDGMQALKEIRGMHPQIPVIMLTATKTLKTAVEAMKLGAYDYITKPFDVEELKLIAQKALESRDLRRENRRLQGEVEERYHFDNIIGKSKEMRDIYATIRQIAEKNSTVLIHGESGTGKELVARAIHYNSHRKNKPFVAVNCAAIPETLIESELFGHEKGAFTDAQTRRIGHFELADQGTLFLDEVSELILPTQAKILRALQERDFVRVGGGKTISVDVRLISATNKNLEEMMARGAFRSDLFYRINVVPLTIPPLRKRKEDILLLAKHFLDKHAGVGKKKISPEAMDILIAYDWPGNVRELENIIERIVVLTTSDTITPDDVPSSLKTESRVELIKLGVLDGRISFEDAEKEFERDIIIEALKKSNFVQTRAADLLGISRRILKYKMDKYSIAEPPEN